MSRAAHGPPEWPTASAEPRTAVERVLERARRELRMDAALLTEVVGGHEVVRAAVGNGRIPGFATGAAAPLDDTICKRLLDGTIDSVVRDVARDARTHDLPAVKRSGLAAYIGVPFTGGTARRYVLCCLAGEARPDLTEADVRFLRGLVAAFPPAIDEQPGARL
ncbi:MAG TPA: GAF domain-containing protein [Solirubrobacteraceae bacterium]|nr:GAF domain-containing protein [Solirubrobacteraceae bacterium]